MNTINNVDHECPCTKCRLADFCNEKKTACRTFSNYLNHGFNYISKRVDNFKIPTMFFYNKCYPQDKIDIPDAYFLSFGRKIYERGMRSLAFTIFGMSKEEVKKALALYKDYRDIMASNKIVKKVIIDDEVHYQMKF